MVVLLSVRRDTPFLGKFGAKNRNCQFQLKLCTKTNSNMQNSVVLFTFSFLVRKHPLWANLVQKIKIVCLSWNLVLRLIWIFRIQSWCSGFLFNTEVPFLLNVEQFLSQRPCGSRDVEIGSTAFSFVAVCLWIDFVHCLKSF